MQPLSSTGETRMWSNQWRIFAVCSKREETEGIFHLKLSP